MKTVQFPIFKTKTEKEQIFDLSNPEEQREYFMAKAGKEIEKLRDYMEHNTFIAYLMGKKNSGKGTYARLFIDIVGGKNVAHFSIGDMVRGLDAVLADKEQKAELIDFLNKNYRGFVSVDDIIKALESRDTKGLSVPDEALLALVKREISKMSKKTLLIDGFPRNLDQVSYSLYFRDLIDYREDPDLFVLIDVPEAVIDERIRYRVVCPKCHSINNFKLHSPAKECIRYDEQKKEFYFVCSRPGCKEVRMVSKEGDDLGIKAIKDRLEMDEKLIKQAFSLYGIPKVLLRNSIPKDVADKYVDKYEITPEFSYKWNNETKEVQILKKPWIVPDDLGVPSYGLLPQPMVVAMIKQIAEVFSL